MGPARHVITGLVLAALLVVPTAQAAPSKLQTTFHTALLHDARTTPAIKRALRAGAVLVDPRPLFGDLTGDGRADAVVSVLTGGAAGAVAVYVFSTDGATGGALRVVFRSQRLYRATAALGPGSTLILRTPRYADGDRLCCPAKIRERSYAWAARERTLRATGTREVAGPPVPQR